MNKVLFLLVVSCLLVSCYTTTYVSQQPYLQKTYIGATKYTIKQDLGVPTRVVHDNELGEILIYERYTTNTTNHSNTSASLQTYNNIGYATGKSITNEKYRTYEERDYLEFYFKEGCEVCYQVKTNLTDVIHQKNKTATGLLISLSSIGGLLALLFPILLAL